MIAPTPKVESPSTERERVNPWLIFALIETAIVAAWIVYPVLFLETIAPRDWPTRGQFGDSFGALNTLFSGLAFGALIVAVILQTRELALQRQELKDTRAVLMDTATATQDTVRAMGDNARKELRAYVGMVNGEIRFAGGAKHIAWLDFSNMGKTPAHDITSWIEVRVRGRDPHVGDFPKSTEESAGGVLVPNATWRLTNDVPLHDLNMDTLERGPERLWVWGELHYRDIFDEPCQVQFRYWAGAKRTREGKYYWPLIPDKNGTKATYGRKNAD